MTKLKNTATNKMIVLGSVVALGYIAGRIVAGQNIEHRSKLSLAGAFVGLLISQGVMSWVVEPNKEK